MTSAYYRCTVTIPHDSGLPRDAVENVWSFRNVVQVDHEADSTEIESRLRGFYQGWSGNFSSEYDLGHVRLKIVDLAETAPRLPFYDEETSFVLGSQAAQDLPAEVSLCLSFKATSVSGQNPRRRRGRVYLGPFALGSAGDFGGPDLSFCTALVSNAISELAVTTNDVTWCVYSPYTHRAVPVGTKLDPDVHAEVPANLFNATPDVAYVWCDNAWDTQRRRGRGATDRASDTV